MDRVIALDALRRKRNLTDYGGVGIDNASLEQAIEEANGLVEHVETWIERNHPDLPRAH